ncbi:hypothetical protein [Clostridium pasteurianum]|uniref:Uncharacterized protein n=1 Tax=Clostridium pasteurianum BC1 TaxID=86416 RepID=R4JYP4_CLOPA|nr:hypothetical protein [Clostridium pasteurianum]AGK95947.1 hypothetical protein Clopa_0930 [Clostridium pasteurianum BC1]
MKFTALDENTSSKTQNLKNVEERLYNAQSIIKDCIKLTLEDINSNPSCEKEYVVSWANYLKSLSDYFFVASENSGNKDIYKKVFRRMMFK